MSNILKIVTLKDNDIFKIDEYNNNENKYKIYLDDTIDTLKKKIMIYNKNLPFESIYLFCQVSYIIDIKYIYEALTNNGKNLINKIMLSYFLKNINNEKLIDKLEDKSIYEFSDLQLLNLDKKEVILNVPIGQKYINNYQFILSNLVNPYELDMFDLLYEKKLNEELITTNRELLKFSIPVKSSIIDNTIYLCEIENVMTYLINKNLPNEIIINSYFPFLKIKEIVSIDDYLDNKEKLLLDSKKLIDKNLIQYIENINLFYEIDDNTSVMPNYEKRGIENISFKIQSYRKSILPIDIIFKVINSTINLPFIKLNLSKSMENIYRLYTDKITNTGKKLPFLNKSQIFKLMKTIGKTKTVSFFVNTNSEIKFLCEFEYNGDINVYINNLNYTNIDNINIIVKQFLNPIIKKINDVFEKNGYNINYFNNLSDSNILIREINYNYNIEITRNINLNKIVGCLSSVFSIQEGLLKKGITIRFKRVNYFSEMDSTEAFIIENINKEVEKNEIIELLEDNFNLDREKALEKLSEVLSSMEVVSNLYKKKQIKQSSNPGFLITINQEKFNNNINIQIENINNLFYLETLDTYINSLILLTQNIESINVDQEKIEKLCTKNKATKEIIEVEDFKNTINEQENDDELESGELYFKTEKDEKDESYYNLLLGIDSDDEEELVGGADDIEIGSPVSDASSRKSSLEKFGSSISIGSPVSNASSEIGSPVSDASSEKPSEKLLKEELSDASSEKPTQEPTLVSDKKETLGKVITIKPKPKTNKNIENEIESSKLVKDITGLSLSNPNPFSERLEERDPKLFLINEKDGKFNAYSRQCQWNARRQPVILTDKEKERIDKEHPGSYNHAIKYGSDPNKQYWYICPRYWSLTKNTSLTEEDVKSGKYGNVIPQNAKKVPKDTSIFEFTDNRVHKGDDGNYIQHYPGFILKKDSHPDGLCLPCCFKSWDTPSQKKRRDECKSSLEKENVSAIKEDVDLIKLKTEGDNYIKGSDKFPLDINRWGFLPIVIQKFLRTDNKLCQISISNINLKQNHICILRQGVETSSKQSFLACIANAYKSQISGEKIYTINFIKKVIINSLNIDIFSTLQNGSLINIFYNKNITIDIEKYTSSKLYKDNEFFKRLVNSYENYINYLNSNEYIDYTYLWDLICMPNINLFKNGINLVILEMTNDDITDNVKLICPTNNYSNSLFDKHKKTLILMKNGVYFEPIYTLLDSGNEYKIQRLFDLNDDKLLQNLKDVLLFISDSLNKNCKPRESIADIYEFKQNKSLIDIIKILKSKNIKINYQLLNYNGLVIALNIEYNQTNLYLPVFPSGLIIDNDLKFKYIDEEEWNGYEITRDLLNNLSEISNKEILSKPKIKVEEDGLIIGIITETNQFIGIDPPIQDTFGDDLIKINDSNYIVADQKTLLNNNLNNDRNKVLLKIKLENEMFTAFRNTIRIILGKEENNNELELIKTTVLNQDDYIKKLDEISDILKKISQDFIEFIDLNDNDIFSLKDIDICINNSKDNCEINTNCKFRDTCKLLLAKNNLINNNDNSLIYYGRLADQLIRYKRINNFILKQTGFIALNKIDYKLNDNEIIILQSMLNQEYFEGNIVLSKNEFVENTSYFNVNPYKQKIDELKILFSNIKNKKKLVLKEKEPDTNKPVKSLKKLIITKKDDCTKLTKPITPKWKPYFPINTNEIEYNSLNTNCSFQIIIDIIIDFGVDIDLTKLKNDLINEYENYGKDLFLIYNILSNEGKINISKKLLIGEIDIQTTIMSESYYLSNLDILILSNLYKLPLILLSSTKIKENNKSFLITNKSDIFYYFIKVPVIKYDENIPYRLYSNSEQIKIEKNKLSLSLQNDIRIEDEFNVYNYIKKYKVTIKKSVKLKVVRDETETLPIVIKNKSL